MAGDWIKMRTNLDTDPRVIAMASALNLPELHIVGCCWKVWSWADSHTQDGNAIRVTDVTLDRFTGVTGFAAALRNVGWLEGRDNALTLPRFAEHNGQTAKKRGETAIRVAKCRNAKRVTDVTQKVLPEKRREEKKDTPKPPKGDSAVLPELPPTLDTPEFRERLQQWLNYRGRKAYKAEGLAAMISRAANLTAEHGLPAVCNAIERAMANGWKGWDQANAFEVPRGVNPPPKPPPPNQPVPKRIKPVDWSNAGAP